MCAAANQRNRSSAPRNAHAQHHSWQTAVVLFKSHQSAVSIGDQVGYTRYQNDASLTTIRRSRSRCVGVLHGRAVVGTSVASCTIFKMLCKLMLAGCFSGRREAVNSQDFFAARMNKTAAGAAGCRRYAMPISAAQNAFSSAAHEAREAIYRRRHLMLD